MMEMCNDDRFKIIEKAKDHILSSTNINTSEDEMNGLDNFLFRCWQMGWLDKYKKEIEPMTNADRIRNMTDEELADWMNNMCDFEKDDEPYKSIYNIYTDEEEEVHGSYGDILEWLQKEAEEQ